MQDFNLSTEKRTGVRNDRSRSRSNNRSGYSPNEPSTLKKRVNIQERAQNESSPENQGEEEEYDDQSPSGMQGEEQSYGDEGDESYSQSNAHPYPKQTPGAS